MLLYTNYNISDSWICHKKIPNSVRNMRAYSKTHLVQNIWKTIFHRLIAGKKRQKFWTKKLKPVVPGEGKGE